MKEHSGLKLNSGLIYDGYDRGQKDFITLYKKYMKILSNRNIYICTVKDFKQNIEKDNGSFEEIIAYINKIKTHPALNQQRKDALSVFAKKMQHNYEQIKGYNETDIICFKTIRNSSETIALTMDYSLYGKHNKVKYANIEIICVIKKGRNVNRMFRFVKAILENYEYSYNHSYDETGIHNYFETTFLRS